MSEFEIMSDQERLRCAVLYEEVEVIQEILEIREYQNNPEKINALYKVETHLCEKKMLKETAVYGEYVRWVGGEQAHFLLPDSSIN